MLLNLWHYMYYAEQGVFTFQSVDKILTFNHLNKSY